MSDAINRSKQMALHKLNEMTVLIPQVKSEISQLGKINGGYPRYLLNLAIDVLVYAMQSNTEELEQ